MIAFTQSFVAFIIALGILVFFHEFGHFLMARLCGVGVEIFSLGFGPRIVGRKRGRTDYRISAIPLGGFVKMVGEEPDAEVAPEDLAESFTHKPVWKRFLIVLAGPVFNLLLAVLIFFVMFWNTGTYVIQPIVGQVQPNSPAERAGLAKDDRITAIDGMTVDTWDRMAELISGSGGRALRLTVRRGDQTLELPVTPESITEKNLFGETITRHIIGVKPGGEKLHHPLGPVDAFGESLRQTVQLSWMTLAGIGKMIRGTIPVRDNLGGPIAIAQMAGQVARQGLAEYAFYIALLSISLGVLNLLPIPVLDGGHLFFFTIEVIIRRPLDTRLREKATQAGFFILLLLILFTFYNDIARIFSGAS